MLFKVLLLSLLLSLSSCTAKPHLLAATPVGYATVAAPAAAVPVVAAAAAPAAYYPAYAAYAYTPVYYGSYAAYPAYYPYLRR
ncbi:uncharacterized protein LOC108652017 [Drosophila navojoa]|nr:uncharacterized protein LOC108652017 [Drosophila navojoa]XP_030241727.1 uncharacterized protein LOC108652017 [Drosophila navojoa]XP_030241728.1 uncharacterized protein LOC108652017 [Drosophila navojoa]XP_030241729.1 uncharacterized protein LOC108652017 [Drosophila navojoa]XP_030241730.1 uncharacterized protein LOC108652017 [Drosophila navojoa]